MKRGIKDLKLNSKTTRYLELSTIAILNCISSKVNYCWPLLLCANDGKNFAWDKYIINYVSFRLVGVWFIGA